MNAVPPRLRHWPALLPGAGLPSLPQPPGLPVLGHLPRWAGNPLQLLADGARSGPVFRLRLWRPAVVGYQPDWNRAVLSDLDTFRSRGSLSRLTPYLSAGIVQTDAPEHRPRRRALNRQFSGHALASLGERLAEVAERHQPCGTVDAVAWSAELVQHMLNVALFGGALPAPLLRQFLRPLHGDLPVPMLPRPALFRRVDRAIAQVLADPPPGSIAACLAAAAHPASGSAAWPRRQFREAIDDLRIALAAGYDTTGHTLAWAIWHLAGRPEWRKPEVRPFFLDEILRHYPAGWLGSRVTSRPTVAAGVSIPAGTLVLYSPYLTHHDPTLWDDPHLIRPERFESGHPSWAYLPFAAGPRTCLGAHLARLILDTALTGLRHRHLVQAGGDPEATAGLTLRPHGPLLIQAFDHARLQERGQCRIKLRLPGLTQAKAPASARRGVTPTPLASRPREEAAPIALAAPGALGALVAVRHLDLAPVVQPHQATPVLCHDAFLSWFNDAPHKRRRPDMRGPSAARSGRATVADYGIRSAVTESVQPNGLLTPTVCFNSACSLSRKPGTCRAGIIVSISAPRPLPVLALSAAAHRLPPDAHPMPPTPDAADAARCRPMPPDAA